MIRGKARIGFAVGLAIASIGLAAASGCSAVLGIGELPIDAGSESADAANDRVRKDHQAPEAGHDAGACVPACSGSMPYCLGHTCVQCKPNSVGCDTSGAPQECNAGGTWVPSPACPMSAPLCLKGSCVQCLPTTYAASCLPDAGGLQYCSEAGVVSVSPCPCANVECQTWPTGKMGDCHYDASTTTRYNPGTVLDCWSLEVDNGATVEFVGNPEGGTLDAAGTWSVIGVVNGAVVNGTITSQIDSIGTNTTVKGRVPGGDGGKGEPLSYTFVQAEGGAGGSAGWPCYGFADGGRPAFGNGGGGGGATYLASDTPLSPGATFCGGSCSYPLPGPGAPGGPGLHATQWNGGGGGACLAIPADGGAGANVFADAGASGTTTTPGEGSGGGGGSRGKHGGLLYMKVLGTVSGSGLINLSGQAGGAGGTATLPNDVGAGLCQGLPSFSAAYESFSGAGSGGGGGGGCGGAFILRYPGDPTAFLKLVNVSGGTGGPAPPSSNSDNQSGANGPAGLIDAGPIP